LNILNVGIVVFPGDVKLCKTDMEMVSQCLKNKKASAIRADAFY
jgi:hypothetical protein